MQWDTRALSNADRFWWRPPLEIVYWQLLEQSKRTADHFHALIIRDDASLNKEYFPFVDSVDNRPNDACIDLYDVTGKRGRLQVCTPEEPEVSYFCGHWTDEGRLAFQRLSLIVLRAICKLPATVRLATGLYRYFTEFENLDRIISAGGGIPNGLSNDDWVWISGRQDWLSCLHRQCWMVQDTEPLYRARCSLVVTTQEGKVRISKQWESPLKDYWTRPFLLGRSFYANGDGFAQRLPSAYVDNEDFFSAHHISFLESDVFISTAEFLRVVFQLDYEIRDLGSSTEAVAKRKKQPYHEATDEPPAELAHQKPFIGDQLEVTGLIWPPPYGRRVDRRQLQRMAERGLVWVRRLRGQLVEVWVYNQTLYAKANSRRLANEATEPKAT